MKLRCHRTIAVLAGAWMLAAPCLFAAEKSSWLANLEAGKSQTIVTYGTSLTAGGAWVGQLRTALEKRFSGRATVINSGAGDMWSGWGVTNLDKRVISKAPDAVLIEFAINDAFLQYKTSSEDAQRNLESMIERIQKARPACEIILMTMNPPIGVHLERRPKIDDYYAVYREVAKRRGLRLIDHHANWQKLLNEDEATFKKYVPDGIHPSALGCEKIILPELLRALGI